MGAFDTIKVHNTDLIREGLQGSVFLGAITAAEINAAALFDAVTGDLKALPAGYTDLGWLTDAGAKFARAIKTNDITSWGSEEPTRSDTTSDTTTLQIEAQETKLVTLGLWIGAATSGITAGVNGAVEVNKPAVAAPQYYRILAVGVDEGSDGELVAAQFLPRARVTAIGDQSYMANGAITYPVTLTAFKDSTLGYSVKYLYGGAGFLARKAVMGFNKAVTATLTTGQPTFVVTAGTLSAEDVGQPVTGTGVPAGATLLSMTDPTHGTLSANATSSGTQTLTIT